MPFDSIATVANSHPPLLNCYLEQHTGMYVYSTFLHIHAHKLVSVLCTGNVFVFWHRPFKLINLGAFWSVVAILGKVGVSLVNHKITDFYKGQKYSQHDNTALNNTLECKVQHVHYCPYHMRLDKPLLLVIKIILLCHKFHEPWQCGGGVLSRNAGGLSSIPPALPCSYIVFFFFVY